MIPLAASPPSAEQPISRFLPRDFRGNGGVTLLAGRGFYPLLCARRMLQLGIPTFLISSEEADGELWNLFPEERRASYNPGQIGKLLKRLRGYGTSYALMAGQIAPKKLFRGLKFDLTALKLLAEVRLRNAETIFGALAGAVEKCDVQLLDARAFMDADLAIQGFMTKSKPNLDQIDHGIEVARSIAALDVGQGVVVRKGTVLAVEGFDGTDKMLRRCNDFATNRKWFIKTSKPRQDFRFDVPVIGVGTLEALREGGVDAVAVEAGCTLLLDRENLLETANRLKIGIYGY